MSQGLASFQRGDFEHAVSLWVEAARLFEKNGAIGKQAEALIKLSRAYQAIGQYNQSLKDLESALLLAKKSENPLRVASALGEMGNVYIAIGPIEKAEQYLNEGLLLAIEIGDSDLSAVILNNLGNLFASQKKYKEAVKAYMKARTLSGETDNRSLAALCTTNAAMASLRNNQYQNAKLLLDDALDLTRKLTHSHDKAYGLINIGLTYHRLRQHLPGAKDLLLRLAFKSLEEAARVAETIKDPRSESYAWGYLGKIYEKEFRYQEALQLTRRASFAAQQANSPESLYQWQWQTGRLLKSLKKIDAAIPAYQRAVDTLQSIRKEMSVTYGHGQSSFREAVGSLYFELVDLLLQSAAALEGQEEYEAYLIEAREKVELLKAAELRDYYQDECVAATQGGITSLDMVSQTAVVIYPIILPDRTELLVSFPDGLKRFSVSVSADRLSKEVKKFRQLLEKRISRQYLICAQKLYDWLIRPLEPDLASLSINTLVFVPDGVLRTIPMAALHDGKQFLAQKYALAITPGLNLTDPRPIERENLNLLAVGLTESSQGFPPLPYVDQELKTIRELFGGKLLLNQDFLISNMENILLEESFNIVHIASHGQFNSDLNKTFLLAFDDKLTMNRLDQCLGFFRFREEKLELLTLSACETAAGDDRAALGLAGVAVKAGARSALATLWFVNDQASSILVTEFYRQLLDPSASRATALQRAQLTLLNDLRYDHPCYWSPFILINNWL